MPLALSTGNGGWSIRNQSTGSFAGWATSSGVLPLVGDFNGDGRDDVALVRQHAGWNTVPVAFSNGTGGWSITNGAVGSFAGWAATSGVRPLVGDFNGDGRDDIALLRQHPGWSTVPIAFSNGAGGWTIRNSSVGSFAGWAATHGVLGLVGDFDGNGRDDIALLRQTPGWGTVPIAFSNGNGDWSIQNGSVGSFAGWATVPGVNAHVGDYDGNGRDDIALVRQSPGWNTVPIAFSNGGGSWLIRNGSVGSFAGWAATSGVRVFVGDYNNDNRDDLALIRQVAGWATMPVAFALGNGNWSISNNTIGSFAGWAATPGVRPLVGDYTGDGRTDVALLRQTPGWGTMPIAVATNQPPITTRRLSVARHQNATGDNGRIDQILSDGSQVLQSNDGSGDVACPVAFARQGNMTVFNNTDGTLNTSDELNTVFGLAPNMKIVPAVDFCANTFNPSFIGCGVIGQFNLIIERFIANQEGILWAHEIGHNVGLNHRTDTSDALMFASIGSNRLRINQAECNAFLTSGGQPLVAGASTDVSDTHAAEATHLSTDDLLGMTDETLTSFATDPMMQAAPDETMLGGLTLAEAIERNSVLNAQGIADTEFSENGMGLEPETVEALSNDPMMQPYEDPAMEPRQHSELDREQTSAIFGNDDLEGPLPPVEEFVRQIYFEGLPLDRAAEYGADEIPILVDILSDPEDVLYHQNAALTLGMIGEDGSVGPLIAYLEEEPELASSATEVEVDYAQKGRVAAVIGLGYAANFSGSAAAVEYLLSTAQMTMDSMAAGGSELDPLAEYRLIALGFTGSAEAIGYLNNLNDGGLALQFALDIHAEDMSSAVNTALSISREIAENGLVEYYSGQE